jgi:hypothetical protein
MPFTCPACGGCKTVAVPSTRSWWDRLLQRSPLRLEKCTTCEGTGTVRGSREEEERQWRERAEEEARTRFEKRQQEEQHRREKERLRLEAGRGLRFCKCANSPYGTKEKFLAKDADDVCEQCRRRAAFQAEESKKTQKEYQERAAQKLAWKRAAARAVELGRWHCSVCGTELPLEQLYYCRYCPATWFCDKCVERRLYDGNVSEAVCVKCRVFVLGGSDRLIHGSDDR